MSASMVSLTAVFCRRIASVANMVRNSDKVFQSHLESNPDISWMFIKIGWLNFLLSITSRDWTESERTTNEHSFKWAEQKNKQTSKQTNKNKNKNDTGFCSNCRSVVRRVYGFRCCFEETAAAATPSSDNEPPVKEILWDIGHSGEEKKKLLYFIFLLLLFLFLFLLLLTLPYWQHEHKDFHSAVFNKDTWFQSS